MSPFYDYRLVCKLKSVGIGKCCIVTIKNIIALSEIYGISGLEEHLSSLFLEIANKFYAFSYRLSIDSFVFIISQETNVIEIHRLLESSAIGKQKRYIKCSIGVSDFSPESDVEILYRTHILSKIALKNNVSILYDDHTKMLDEIMERDYYAFIVKHNVLESSVQTWYQPIVSTNDVKTKVFHEVLARFQYKGNILENTSQLIRSAESYGIIQMLDTYMLHNVIKTLEANPKVRLAFNVSGLSINDDAWLDNFVNTLKRNPFSQRVIVEISESTPRDNIHDLAKRIEIMKTSKCEVAIDDFGMGHSSFLDLQHLSIDYLKIHHSFTNDLANNVKSQKILKSLVNLAQAFDIKTIVERVQNDADGQIIINSGVDYIQGFAFGKPSVSLKC
ncbi:MAG: EAL domain protein [Candidatus Xenolissoclinum pacificiensis L6]|uniref:EAL domain protein n=1 Tax=Candidatus Xenolissoclinum pacificiensis L6 TaxID=1401685 RepID=W2V328_9RICK|nr:MAG: EAL domain protein [Candidatus Xenolissoclinum pacificiensis L6]